MNVYKSWSDGISAGAKLRMLHLALCAILLTIVVDTFLYGQQQDRVLARQAELVTRHNWISGMVTDIKGMQRDIAGVQRFFAKMSVMGQLDTSREEIDAVVSRAEKVREKSASVIVVARELELSEISEAAAAVDAKFFAYFEIGTAIALAHAGSTAGGDSITVPSFATAEEKTVAAVRMLTQVSDQAEIAAETEIENLQTDTRTFRNLLLVLGLAALFISCGVVIYAFTLDKQVRNERHILGGLQAVREIGG